MNQDGKQYFYCKKVNHMKKDCYKWLAKNNNKTPESILSKNNVVDACELLNVTSRKLSNEWILGSDCSYHIYPHRDWFSDFSDVCDESVCLGDNNVCSVN